MKKIIVTGGAGFIGSNLVRSLNELGHTNIIIVDQLRDNGKWKNLVGLKFQTYINKEDFLKLVLEDNLPAFDTIFHLGACSDTTNYDEEYMIKNNSLYSKILFDYCTKKKIRFIYASSGATYGDGSKGYDDKETKLNPINCYGYSKYLFDQWVLASSKKPKQWVGLKFFNVYGPNEYHKGQMASVIYHGFKQAKNVGKIKLFKSYKKEYKHGEQKRDFIYIKDAVKVALFFFKYKNKNGIYNVGTGKARTFLDLTHSVFKAMRILPKVEFIEMQESLKDKYQYFTEAKITSLRKAGYKERFYELEEGVKDYISNYLLSFS